jgi:hypothetical protein
MGRRVRVQAERHVSARPESRLKPDGVQASRRQRRADPLDDGLLVGWYLVASILCLPSGRQADAIPRLPPERHGVVARADVARQVHTGIGERPGIGIADEAQ